MSFRDLLVLGGAGTDAARTYGIWLSHQTGAFLTGAIPVVTLSPPPGLTAELPEDFMARLRDEAEAEASKAARSFMESAREMNATADTIPFDTSPGDIGYALSRLARCFDVSILQQPASNGTDGVRVIQDVLFGSGRPVLIIPYIRTHQEIGNTLIAWDGGIQAARAASDAIPILKLARYVQIMTIGTRQQQPHRSGQDLGRHLTRHGINADVKLLPSEDIDVANALLSHAADNGIDLIVMGGYSHSRLREFVLGGTTREILRSMTVPVFMSH